MDALKRQSPLLFVPIFFTVNLAAGRLPEGTVEVAIKESAEAAERYPVALMFTTKSGSPERTPVVVGPPI